MKTIYVLYYLGEYHDEYESLSEAESIKGDYNSWFGSNCEIKKRKIRTS